MIDKGCVQQVLGCLIQRPQLLSEIDKYSLTVTDFNAPLEKYIFLAICGLYKDGGATAIGAIDIANYLQTNGAAASVFEKQNGIEYVQDIIEFSQLDNFGYYYNKLKKINLINDLRKQGFNTSGVYEEDLTNPRANEINSQFEQLELKDITDKIKKKLLLLESKYATTEEVTSVSVDESIGEIFDGLDTEIEIGKPIQGDIYSQIIDGAQRGTLTIRSGSSGLGKTRQAVGDACYLAYPVRFNRETNAWEQTGSCEKVLFIITEQTVKQVNKMILAYLTGINESKFKYNKFSNKEWDILNKARLIIKQYKDNFQILKIPNPTIELIKTLVREKVLTHDIGYVFYDYIFIGPALLGEFHGFSLRNDEVLLMFATALKDLAVELNVCMMTATQVNASADETNSLRNEASLSGGRSTINKADNGAIMARPSKEELEIMAPLIQQYGMPNMVTDVFKVRSGAWTQVRVWSSVDLGTMRKTDLFLTDGRLDLVEGFYKQDKYEICDWTDEQENEIKNFVASLNRKE